MVDTNQSKAGMKSTFILILAFIASLPVYPTRGLLDTRNHVLDIQDQKSPAVTDEILDGCGPLFFESRSAKLKGEEKEACLLEVSQWLQRIAPNYYLVIDGHRNESEPKGVSLARAKAAREYLVRMKGIDRMRLIVRDFGATCPYETRDAGLNRRVQFWYWRERASIGSVPNRCASGAKPKSIVVE